MFFQSTFLFYKSKELFQTYNSDSFFIEMQGLSIKSGLFRWPKCLDPYPKLHGKLPGITNQGLALLARNGLMIYCAGFHGL